MQHQETCRMRHGDGSKSVKKRWSTCRSDLTNVSEETVTWRKDLDESGKFSMDGIRTNRRDPRVENERRSNGGFLNRTEKSLDHVTVSSDCCESLVTRLLQQIRELQETVNGVKKPRTFNTRKLANSEVPGHTFTFLLSRSQVSEASFANCTDDNPPSRNIFELFFLSTTTSSPNPCYWEPTPVFVHKCLFATPQEILPVSLIAASQAATFRAAANTPKPKVFVPRPAKLGGRSAEHVEVKNRGSADSRSTQQLSGSLPECYFSTKIGTTSPFHFSNIEGCPLVMIRSTPWTFSYWQFNFRKSLCCSLSFV